MWFMLAAGARPKEIKINLMDCICMCSEVKIGFWNVGAMFSSGRLVHAGHRGDE